MQKKQVFCSLYSWRCCNFSMMTSQLLCRSVGSKRWFHFQLAARGSQPSCQSLGGIDRWNQAPWVFPDATSWFISNWRLEHGLKYDMLLLYIYIVTYVELRWYKPSLKSLFEYVFKQIKLFLFNKCEKNMHRTGLFFSLFYKPSISGFRSKFDLAQRIIPRKMLFVFNTCVFGSSNIP